MFRSSPGRSPPRRPRAAFAPSPAVGRVPVPSRSACFRSGAPEAVRERAAAAHGGTPARAGCSIPPFAARKSSPKNEGDAPSLPDGLLFRLVIPPPPEGTAAIAHAPLTADRIPPAARSGSSACAAPRTSSGAGRGCARSFRTPHPPAVPLPTFGAPHPGARKHRISGEALRQRRRRKTLQRY